MQPDILAAMICAFVSVALFTWLGFSLFAKGWESYEEKYVKGAGRTLESMYLTIPPQHLLYLSFLSTVVVTALIAASFGNLALGVGLGLVAFPLPGLVIHLLKKARDHKFGEQLVDALVSMSNSLKAGLSMPMALELVARETENPMGQEMRLVNQEMRLGVTMERALENLHQRMPSEDLDLLVTSILISREVGGNLTEVFDNIANTIRERHRIEGKVKALTAQGKLQGLVVAVLPIGIAIFLHIWNPQMMEKMYTTWVGGVLIGIIIVMELLGVYVIKKIVTIEV